jgi:4-amino-4-deoxy-L-arabinose transferase-like glycosyltransferase
MSRPQLHFGWSLTAILAVALLLRLAAGIWWQQRLPAGQNFAFGDSESYWQLARALAHGQPFEYGPDRLQIFRTPGYPACLAPLFWFSDNPPVIWARAISAILGTAAVGLTALLARLLFNDLAGLLAGAIAAIYPESIALGVFVLSEAGFTPCFLLSLVCWTLARRPPLPSPAPPIFWAIAAGFFTGLATLMRPSWLLFVPFTAICGLIALLARRATASNLSVRPILAAHTRTFAFIFLGLCLTMLPWWIRNYVVAGRFIPTTLQVGASLYDGLSPTATGASDMRFVGKFVAEQRAADAQPNADLSHLFEDRLDSRMRNASLSWAKAHPRRVLELAGIKFLRIWSFLPNANEFQNRWLRLALLTTYTPIIALALLGIWKYSPRGWPYLLCWLPAVYLTCLHIIFVSSIRYRQPALLPLIVLASGVLIELLPRTVGPASLRAPAHQSPPAS